MKLAVIYFIVLFGGLAKIKLKGFGMIMGYLKRTAPTDMQLTAVSYFKSLYTRDPSVDCERLIELTPEQISEDMNTQLCKEFSNEEISDALFQIVLLKLPVRTVFLLGSTRGTVSLCVAM
jgi:hypothetical protein